MTLEEQILQYIIDLGPALSAIITILCSLFVSIKKYASIKVEAIKEIKGLTHILDERDLSIRTQNEELQYEIRALITENIELKQEIKRILRESSPIKEAGSNEKGK